MSKPTLPITITSSTYPDEIVATIYEDYYTKELRLAIAVPYLEQSEFDKVVEAYNNYKSWTPTNTSKN